MIDTLIRMLPKAASKPLLQELGMKAGSYVALTLHRPSNVDDRATLASLVDVFDQIQQRIPIIFPVHPRTRKNLADFHLLDRVENMKNLRLLTPLSYLDFLCLYSSSKLVLSDSGGIQSETSFLKIPCLTLRDTTEFGVTVDLGSNHLVGNSPNKILSTFTEILEGRGKTPCEIPLWDGLSAMRIRDHYLKLV